MTYPAGVQTSRLTFSNPKTHGGKDADRTEITVQPTASIVWAETGEPLDDFQETVSPSPGMPGFFTAPFVDQPGVRDQAGNAFTMWAYIVTRRSWLGGVEGRPVRKTWQPLLGQAEIDFDTLPGGSMGLPVSVQIPPVTSVAGLTSVVGAAALAGALVPHLPNDVTPESVAAALPTRLGAAALDTTFAKIDAGRVGARWLFLGDSITAGSITPDNAYWSQAFAVQAALLSKGQIIMVRNAGIPGNTTAQMDSRFATDVTPYASRIDTVFLLAGTNDSTVTPMATWVASMKSIIAKIRALGKQPIMATIPPNNNTAPRPAAITQQNAWIRRYAGQNGIPLVDFYKALVDPSTGGFRSGYNADATHPAAPGREAMSAALVNTLQPLLSPSPVIIPQDNKDPNNLLTNGCFVDWSAPVTVPAVTTGTVATGGTLVAGTYFYKVTVLNYQGESLPSAEASVTITAGQQPQLTITNPGGQRVLNIYRSTAAGAEVLLAANVSPAAYPTSTVWADTGALTPGTQTPPTQDYTTTPTGWGSTTGGPAKLSKVTDPAFQGHAARFTATGAQHGQGQNIAMAGKYSVGDTLALAGVLRSGGQTPNVSLKFNGGAAPNTFTVLGDGVAGAGGVYYREVVVPAGTTSIDVYFQNDAGAAGSVDFGQLGVYNLTTLGVL